jgi:hypothetical protein
MDTEGMGMGRVRLRGAYGVIFAALREEPQMDTDGMGMGMGRGFQQKGGATEGPEALGVGALWDSRARAPRTSGLPFACVWWDHARDLLRWRE